MPPVFAQTTTTEVPRVVGDPLPSWVVILASLALLVVVLVAGWLATRHTRKQARELGR